MDLSRLKNIFKDEPKYRYRQAYQAVFSDLITDWQAASSLPQDLRANLARECPLEIRAAVSRAADGTEKALLTLEDGRQVEAVLIRQEAGLSARKGRELQTGRNTVCVSSQVGCPMGCLFCATGRIGFQRNLERDEIIEQILFFSRRLKKENRKVDNVVFMGMGEPFLNYDNVLAAIKFLNDPGTLGLGARRFSISTAGVTHGIKKLAAEKLEINLALSLHAPDNKTRDRIMPINQKYPLDKVLKEIKNYIAKTRRRVMFEYVMIDGVNDSPAAARELARLLKGQLGFVNLIAYNDTAMFRATPAERIRRFQEILEQAHIAVTVRQRFGEGIAAACGQLAAKGTFGKQARQRTVS